MIGRTIVENMKVIAEHKNIDVESAEGQADVLKHVILSMGESEASKFIYESLMMIEDELIKEIFMVESEQDELPGHTVEIKDGSNVVTNSEKIGKMMQEDKGFYDFKETFHEL